MIKFDKDIIIFHQCIYGDPIIIIVYIYEMNDVKDIE